MSFPSTAHLRSASNPKVVSKSTCRDEHKCKIIPIARTALHFTLSLSFAALTLTWYSLGKEISRGNGSTSSWCLKKKKKCTSKSRMSRKEFLQLCQMNRRRNEAESPPTFVSRDSRTGLPASKRLSRGRRGSCRRRPYKPSRPDPGGNRCRPPTPAVSPTSPMRAIRRPLRRSPRREPLRTIL